MKSCKNWDYELLLILPIPRRQTLIRALGEAAGASLYELAWGRDYRDVEPEEVDKSISAARNF
jgi:nucleotidyltransferase/DNA polymerase involved in DNA repair